MSEKDWLLCCSLVWFRGGSVSVPKISFLIREQYLLWEGAGDVECGGSRTSAPGNQREGRGLPTGQRKQNI